MQGIVESGQGNHSRLHIPGKNHITPSPQDWPTEFAPGSLNIFVPERPKEVSGRKGFRKLDRAKIPPAFTIPQSAIGNNSLSRKLFKPRRGTGQAWRAVLTTSTQTQNVWIFRRIGSHMRHHLEIISTFNLREKLSLIDGQSVTLTMVEKFVTSNND